MTDDHASRGRRVRGLWRLAWSVLGTLVGLVLPIIGPVPGTEPATTTAPYAPPPYAPPPAPPPAANPLDHRGMWIWYVSRTEGGDVGAIIAKAKAFGVGTLMIKAGDGSGRWGQFNSTLVSELHQSGLQVCAWQYVYGRYPISEAAVGASAVRAGADCLLIDAEGEYQGRYVQAQRYIMALRRQIGARFPVALAGLPYVDYHPGFPYSVFLGPGGAQYNVPQMYWFDIGTSVDAVYAHTYRFNSLFLRPVYPLGELTGPPPSADIVRFRQLSIAYGARQVSWWLWQEAGARQLGAMSQPISRLANFAPSATVASISRGARSDLVVWAQQHLVTAGQRIAVDGIFGSATQRAVLHFQAAKALPITGRIDPPTWLVLLRYKPAFVHWWLHVPKRRTGHAAAGSAPAFDAPVPASASIPAVRDEFAGRKRSNHGRG